MREQALRRSGIEQMNETAIVFDLGGVLIDWDPRNLYRKMFSRQEDMERFLLEACNQDFIDVVDAGTPVAEAVAALQAKWPEYHNEIAAFDTRWGEMLVGAKHDTVAILKDLKDQGRKVYALSNYSVEKYEFSKPIFPFLEWFDGLVISGYERVAKPDPKIFQILIDRFGLEPARSLFIDDRIVNVQVAQHLGFSTVLFRTAAELGEALDSSA